MRIFHIATADDWTAAQAAGRYTTSTYGVSLAEEGFIHASRADQWPDVRDRFFGDVNEPLVLLCVDRDRVLVPVVDEPVGDETFPHILGPLNVDAVVQAIPLDEHPGSATTATPVAAPTPAPTASRADPPSADWPNPAARQQDFGTIFLREMFRNALVLVVLLANVMGGAVIGNAVSPGWGALIGLALGLLVGVPLALLVYRQLQASTDEAEG